MLYASRTGLQVAGLFPQTPRPEPQPPRDSPAPNGARAAASHAAGRVAIATAIQVFCVVAGAFVVLYRIAGVPAWRTIFAEDWGVFLIQALRHPWHLFIPYNGYEQLVPRLIAQGAALLPLPWAAAVFAIAGSLIDAACALFIYHASSGYIRSRALRAVLAAALLLLPVAPMELAANGVDCPWYIMVALFWAILWRPRTRGGMVAAAIVAFAATASCPVAILFAPFFALRVFALRQPREHAVTAGWLAAWPVQIWAVAQSYADHHQRVGKLGSLSQAAWYYLHTVPQRAFGWHVSFALSRYLGTDTAAILCAAVLAVMLGLAMLTGSRARIFVPVAVITGIVTTIFTSSITQYILTKPIGLTPTSHEQGSRYSMIPLMLIDAALLIALDALAERYGNRRTQPETAVPDTAPETAQGAAPETARETARETVQRTARPRRPVLVAAVGVVVIGGLAAGWASDYRYPTGRSVERPWSATATRVLDQCRHHRTARMFEWGAANESPRWPAISCSVIHG